MAKKKPKPAPKLAQSHDEFHKRSADALKKAAKPSNSGMKGAKKK